MQRTDKESNRQAENSKTEATLIPCGSWGGAGQYDKTKLLCEYCPCELTQQHLIECPSRVDLREDLDLMKLDDVLVYIQRTVGL